MNNQDLSLMEQDKVFLSTLNFISYDTVGKLCAIIALLKHGIKATENHAGDTYNDLMTEVKPKFNNGEEIRPTREQLEKILRLICEKTIQTLDGEII